MDETLWSTRNVAEFAYCPRLFYLMEVEGLFLPNSDTEKGRAVHRRVDHPSALLSDSEAESDPDRPRSLRRWTLSSPTLGLIAALDLAEINGQTVVPIEYRKGHPKRSASSSDPNGSVDPFNSSLEKPEPWPTDRIQIGLQSLLLQDAGYKVSKAIIYYAAEKTRLEMPVDDSLLTDARNTLEAARHVAEGPRPHPLDNDPRCVRCSLQPLCLPDEINFQQNPNSEKKSISPRRIWPPREEGLQVIAQLQGGRISIRGMNLMVHDREGQCVKEIPLVNIESLSLLGNIQITTQAIHALAEREVPMAFLSSVGRLIALLDPLNSVTATVRKAQVRILDQDIQKIEFARALVRAKMSNQRVFLLRNHPHFPESLGHEFSLLLKALEEAESLEKIRGIEGGAASCYFQYFPDLFQGSIGELFRTHGRQRRPPPDPLNACLSLGYTLLAAECVTALRLASLEPTIGALHANRPGRPALALDLMEPFRPLIVDSICLSLFNRGELNEGHFLKTCAGYQLTESGRKIFFAAYGRRMETVVTHPVFEYRLSYRRMLSLHARMIAAWCLGEIPKLSFLTTR